MGEIEKKRLGDGGCRWRMEEVKEWFGVRCRVHDKDKSLEGLINLNSRQNSRAGRLSIRVKL